MDFLTTPIVIDSIRFWFLGKRKLTGDDWKSFRGLSRKKGVFIHSHDDGKIFVQCSLPRFRFGHNGRLLISQGEIDAAWNALSEWIKRGIEGLYRPTFTQIDLCWHLEGDPRRFITSLQGCSHPQIHGLPAVKPGESLWWGRPNSKRRIRCYDKEMQLNRRPGKVIRIEVSLLGYALRLALNGNYDPVQGLDFKALYDAFRQVLVRFNPKPRAQLKPGPGFLKQFVAMVEMDDLKANGQSALEQYVTKYKNKQSADRVRKEIRAIKLTLGAVDFDQLLPLTIPPAPVHVYPKNAGKRR